MTYPEDDTGIKATGRDGYTVEQLAKAEFKIVERHYYEVVQTNCEKPWTEHIVQKKNYTYTHPTKKEADEALKNLLSLRDDARNIMKGAPTTRVKRVQQLLFGD